MSIMDLIRKECPDADLIRLDSVDITHDAGLVVREVDGVLEAEPVLVETTHVETAVRLKPTADVVNITISRVPLTGG